MDGRKKPVSRSKALTPTNRIETQIHRRRRIKVLSPLQVEWDCFQPSSTEPMRFKSDIERERASDA
jgi:hypothetical protein